MAPYPRLFSPLTIGRRRLRNRVALPATLTNFAKDNKITQRWINFLVERAKGGAGLIVSEIIAVDREAIAHQAVVTGFDGRNDNDFARVAEAVEDAGALLVGQLWHPGRQQLWHPTKSPMGVSDQPDALSWTVPHVMSASEIGRVAEAYVDTARRLQACGFSGVELHGAHGYLIGQFLSPWSNTRTDGYGGELSGRARFVEEIAGGIRAACGLEFIIGLKMPGDEGVEGGIDVAEAEKITRHLAGTGNYDYFAYGQGNFSLSLENHVPDLHFQPGHFIDIAKRMRAVAQGVPVMALGRIGTPDLAEKIVAQGFADLVGMVRAQISDAAWANKAAQGRAEDIRPSVFDNWCWGEIHAGKPLAEHHNPYLGEPGEAHGEERLQPAPVAKSVVVVGAGPAGLEAAWVAAARGHRVTLFGGSRDLGGKLRHDAALPGRAAIAAIIGYQQRMLARHGVVLRLGQTAGRAEVLACNPDAVILATGSRLRRPAGLAADGALDVFEFIAEAGNIADARGGTALFYDQDSGPTAYAAVDLLAARFARVILLTPRTQIAQNVNHCSAIGVHRRLHLAGVEVLTAHDLTGYAQGLVTCRNVFTGAEKSIEGVEKLVYATPRLANDRLSGMFDGIEVHAIGDCQSPRNLMAAIHGGHIAGRSL